jgi:hypothetical protein
MSQPTMLRSLLATLLLLAGADAAVAAAAAADDEEPEEEVNAPWSLALATAVDLAGTRGFSIDIARDVVAATRVRFAADSTDYMPVQGAQYKTQGIELGAVHDFRHVSVDGAIGTWRSTDLVTAKELKLKADYRAAPWSAGLRAGYRRANFNEFESAADVTLPDGTVIPAATSSTCKVTNTAWGADVRYGGAVWGGYLTGMDYRYKNPECDIALTTGSQKVSVDRAVLRELSGGELDRLATGAVRYIGRDQSLLDWSLDAGASWRKDEFVVTLGYARQKEYVVGNTSNTVAVTGTADLGGGNAVDCTLGVTRGATVSQGGFVGFALRAKF